jgi:hypothetical protein
VSDAKPWTFTQLGGDRKELTLTDYDAPFGRPRQHAVVRKGIKIRQRTVRYPGNDGPPTRHVFGDEWHSWELVGRFRDAYGGKGHALRRTDEVTRFVQDKQPVAIRWGDVLACTGFLEEFDPGVESEGEVEWKLRVLIDEDATVAAKRPDEIVDLDAQLKRVTALLLAELPKLPSLPDLKPSFLDAVDGLISSINASIGSVVAAANAVSNIEKATMGQIQRLRAGIRQLRTATLILRNTYASAQEDALLLRRTPLADIDVFGARTKSDIALTKAAADLADADRKAAIATRGKLTTMVTATAGDTWESLASRYLGSADRADALRSINGVRGGEQPVPGRSYKVPFA